MKKIYSILMIAASLTMLWGCSSSDDDDSNSSQNGGTTTELHGETVANAPHWTFDLNTLPSGDLQGKPDWDKVDFYDYENNMTAIVFVSEDFGVRLAEDDRMAAIVNGEARDIEEPVPYYIPDVENTLYCFMLYIPYDSDDDEVELQYYHAASNQTYIAKNIFNVKDDTVGDDELFLFTLRPMTARFLTLPDDLPFTPSPDDEMAVFIGDECCGVGERQENVKERSLWLMTAHNMNKTDAKAHVRYYSAQTKTIYRTEPYLDIKLDYNSTTIDTLRFK